MGRAASDCLAPPLALASAALRHGTSGSWMAPRPLHWAVLAVLLLLAGTGSAATARALPSGQAETAGAKPSYANIWEAVQNETWLMPQLSGRGEFEGTINVMAWIDNQQFNAMQKIASNPKSNLTIFLPGPKSAFEKQAAAQCLTLKEWLNELNSNPSMTARYVQSFFLPRATPSSSFYDGMTLREQTSTSDRLVVGRKEVNRSTQWILRNASAVKVPGLEYTYEDVGIIPYRMDIQAGNSIVHIIDLPLRVDSLEPFWAERRAKALRDAGWPADSPTCPEKAQTGPSKGATIGVAVGAAVGGAALIAGACLAVLCLRKRGRCGGAKPTDAEDGMGPLGTKRPRGSESTTGATDAMTDVPSLKDQDSIPSSTQPPTTVTGSESSPPGSRMGVFVKASGSPYNSSGGLGASSSGMSTGPYGGPYGGPSSSSGPYGGVMAQGSVMNADNSPFAMFTMDSGDMALAAGMSVAAPAAAYASTGTNGRSSGRGSSSRAPGSNRSTGHNSGGSNNASDESGRDGLAPLPGPGAIEQQGRGLDHTGGSVAVDFKSYDGGLQPTPSMPMGQIPHALVVPYAELQLEDLIGAGAEGKVYRGTWKHTEIAAKEYLPHLPGEAGSTEPNSPLSEAAKANAQAALAKEVYWLTRLNHPNLVRFCAVCLERPMVVMEFYKNGSVFDIIRKAEMELGDMSGPAQQSAAQMCCQYLSWDRRLMMLHDVAAGMSYLHGRNHIHGDLRSPNLFVGADGKVKIGDFGFTKRLALNKASLRVARITHPRWVAPELLMDNILSRASDVYSFGVIMYELLTFRIPFEGCRKEQVVLEVMRGNRPEVPPQEELPPGTSSHSCLDMFVRLMRDCWAQEAADRPCFEVIARRLKAMQRWRKLKVRLQHVGEAARRVQSMPAIVRHGTGIPALGGNRAGGGADDSMDEVEEGSSPRRVASAPPAGGSSSGGGSAAQQQGPGSQQQQKPLGARLREELLRPAPAPAWQPPLLSQLPPANSLKYAHGISSIPEVEAESGGNGTSSSQEASIGPPHTGGFLSDQRLGDDMSSLVTSTDMHGTRLAIIPTGPAVEEQDALASVLDPEQIAAAKRVLLVASDLPSRYAPGVHEHGIRVRRSWKRHLRRSNT